MNIIRYYIHALRMEWIGQHNLALRLRRYADRLRAERRAYR